MRYALEKATDVHIILYYIIYLSCVILYLYLSHTHRSPGFIFACKSVLRYRHKYFNKGRLFSSSNSVSTFPISIMFLKDALMSCLHLLNYFMFLVFTLAFLFIIIFCLVLLLLPTLIGPLDGKVVCKLN